MTFSLLYQRGCDLAWLHFLLAWLRFLLEMKLAGTFGTVSRRKGLFGTHAPGKLMIPSPVSCLSRGPFLIVALLFAKRSLL